MARRGKKRRLKREESGRRKRAPKHRVSRPERKSRNRNFCGSRSPSAAGQPGMPGSFRSTTMGHRIAAAGRAPPPPPGEHRLVPAAKGSGVPPSLPPHHRLERGRLQRGPPVGDTWMAPDPAEPRGPAAARDLRPRVSQGAERRFRVPPSGMKAAASASRRSGGAGLLPASVPRTGSPPDGCCEAGSGSGAEEVRSLLSRRWVHAAAFLRGRGREERRARSFNTERDAAGVISLCPGGSAASPAVPPQPPATLGRFPSLRTCHQLCIELPARHHPLQLRALLAGQPRGQEEDPRPDEERGAPRDPGCPGTPRDRQGRGGSAPPRAARAAFARRGLETMGLQRSHVESSAGAKFLEEKKKNLQILVLLNGWQQITPFSQISASLLELFIPPTPYVRWKRQSSTFKPRKQAGPLSKSTTRFKDQPTSPKSPFLPRAGTAAP